MSLTEKSSFGFVSSCVSTKQLLFVGTEQCVFIHVFFRSLFKSFDIFWPDFFSHQFQICNIPFKQYYYYSNDFLQTKRKKNMSFRNSRSLTVDPFLVDFFRALIWHSTYLHLMFWTMYANYSVWFLIIYIFYGTFQYQFAFINIRLFGRNLERSIVINFFRKKLDWGKKWYHIIFERKIVWILERLWHLKKTTTFEEDYDIWRPKV